MPLYSASNHDASQRNWTMDRPPDAEGHRVAELLHGGRRAERQHDRLAAVGLDQADRLLDRALLVGRDREAEMARVDGPLVGGQDHPPGDRRNALDADENAHRQARTRRFSGSNSGRAPTTATVTG